MTSIWTENTGLVTVGMKVVNAHGLDIKLIVRATGAGL